MFYIGVLTNYSIGKLNLESGLWAIGRRKCNFLVRPRNFNPTFRYLRGVFGQNFKILASKMSPWLNLSPEKSSKKVGFSLGSLYSLALFFQLLVGQLVNDSESCETQNTSIYYRQGSFWAIFEGLHLILTPFDSLPHGQLARLMKKYTHFLSIFILLGRL